jgi:hypothetical protein
MNKNAAQPIPRASARKLSSGQRNNARGDLYGVNPHALRVYRSALERPLLKLHEYWDSDQFGEPHISGGDLRGRCRKTFTP